MRSSYIENNFGLVFKSYVLEWRPVTLVEFGVLDGYSTLNIAQGVKELDKLYGIKTKLISYDLFDDYQFKHGDKEEVEKLLLEQGVSDYVNLIKENAYKVYKDFQDESLEFLHVDISNTGDIIKKIIELWHPKMRGGSLVLLEGGSSERDNVEWMIKYNMSSIKKEIETNEIINKYYMYRTYFKFPSMTVLVKK